MITNKITAQEAEERRREVLKKAQAVERRQGDSAVTFVIEEAA